MKTKGLAVLALCAFLSACSAMQGIGAAVNALGGSAPSVDATAQVGQENRQEGDSVLDNRRVEDNQNDAKVEVREVSGVSNVDNKNVQDQQGKDAGVSSRDWQAESILVQTVPTFVLILLALGWFLPSPAKVFHGIGKGILFIRDVILGRK